MSLVKVNGEFSVHPEKVAVARKVEKGEMFYLHFELENGNEYVAVPQGDCEDVLGELNGNPFPRTVEGLWESDPGAELMLVDDNRTFEFSGKTTEGAFRLRCAREVYKEVEGGRRCKRVRRGMR